MFSTRNLWALPLLAFALIWALTLTLGSVWLVISEIADRRDRMRSIEANEFDQLSRIRCLAYSRSAGHLLVGDIYGKVRTFRMSDLSFLGSEQAHRSQVMGLSVAHTQGLANAYVSCGLDDRVVFHGADGRSTAIDHLEASRVQISEHDTYVVSASALSKDVATIWTLPDLSKLQTVSLKERARGYVSLAVSPDEQNIALCPLEGGLIVWNIPAARISQRRQFSFPSHVSYSESGSHLYLLDDEAVFTICDTALSTVLKLEVSPFSFAFFVSGDEKWLITGGASSTVPGAPGRIEVWDLMSRRRTYKYLIKDHQITSMVAVEDQFIVTGSLTGKRGLMRWSVEELLSGKQTTDE